MLIEGIFSKQRTDFIINKCRDIYQSANNDGIILTVVLNSYKKACLIKKLKKIMPDYNNDKLKILTFAGLCYNTFLDNGEYIAKLTKTSENGYKANLCGLDVSQYIFKQSIKEGDFSDYISKVNLLHQLFRRYSLIVQNALTNKEIIERAEILNESFYKDAQKAIDDYKIKTIKLKSFDYLRQMAILPSIYNNTDYFKNIRYLIIDDADEYPYAFWQLVYALMPNLKEYYITYDKDGSSRCGYLCAYKSAIDEFKIKYNPKIIKINCNQPFYKTAQELFTNIIAGKKTKINDIKVNSCVRRLEMINKMVSDVKNLLNHGVNPADITVVTPVIDDILKDTINSTQNIHYTLISGNEKLSDNQDVKFILSVLKLSNNIELKDFELKNLLINLLKIPFKSNIQILQNYSINKELTAYDFNSEIYNTKYQKLLSIINSLKASKENISEQIKIIYDNLGAEFNKKNYEFLYKEAQSFETAFTEVIENSAKEFIIQTENSIISENPIDSIDIQNDSIIIASPQKVIDFSIESKYQFWLDISSNEWIKEDTGTIYNSWVYSRDWTKSEFTLEDNINLTRDKSARIIRKLILLAKKEIIMYSSLYDTTGNENYSGLTDYIEINENKNNHRFNITPRDDQKNVLDYQKGKLGIMAVPGAGKTTILLLLIIKLMQQGIKGENIFVLTYMESAAKNFKEKLKSAMPDCLDLPNISTIHGLALRIIKENGNYIKAGLDENFQICDDNLKEKLIKELMLKNKINDDNFESYLRCISTVKLSKSGGKITSKYKEIKDFINFYNEYNITLKQNNLIDYDDMLYYAVNILKKYPEILNYYQNICRYIIEDEAQDSTQIQQQLINMLSGKYKNIIRCGDINQAITSTFTNSDTGSFREFISSNKKIEMTSSQRCAKPIYDYANNFVKRIHEDENLKTAFYYIQMQGTNKNPKSEETPAFTIFEREAEEKLFILNKIKEIQKKNPKASIGILLRLNSQVNEYNEYFQNNGIKTQVRSDCPERQKIYRIITSVLKAVENPLNNKYISDLAINILKTDKSEYINSLKEAFISKNADEFEDEEIAQLYWDIEYWLNQSVQNIDILGLKAGLYYAKNETEKENAYIISALIKRLSEQYTSNEEIIKQLEYIGQKPLSSYKFFEEETEGNESQIQIMTTHKSKGDEFDYVFIAGLNEENYPINKENVKLKGNSHFLQTIKSIAEESGLKTPEILKQEQINETLRLIYVGITRAKLGLYMSSAKSYKRYKKIKINDIFLN